MWLAPAVSRATRARPADQLDALLGFRHQLGRLWLRGMLTHATEAAKGRPDAELRSHFDGSMLKLQVDDEVVGAPAKGSGSWPAWYRVTLTPANGLPKRLATDPVEVGIWEAELEVGRHHCRVERD